MHNPNTGPSAQTLVVIGWVWPEPQASAAGHNMLALLRAFRQQNWRVIFASPAEPTPLSYPLASVGVESQAITVNDSSFDHWLAEINPFAVMFDRFLMEEQFGWRVAKVCPDAVRVLDTEDLQCLRYARLQAHRQGRTYRDDDLDNEIARREIASIYRSDLSLVISAHELQLLEQRFHVPPHLLFHKPLALGSERDMKPLAEPPGFAERDGFITIGNFRHAPNWDSVLYLRQLWPAVRQRLPSTEIRIYGAYMPPKARQLHNPKLGFRVEGWIDDALMAMSRARVCAAPLRFGAGQKGKLLLAMCAATPSVTTSVGMESMVAEGDPWPGVVADTDEALVDALVEQHQNESAWESAHRQARVLAGRSSDQNNDAELLARVEALAAELGLHRAQNFIGTMLNHHHHQSTRYLSQWIESKHRLAKLQDSQ